ncbi:MAG: HEAT repeat domain-containing protein, partial [Gemmataceae bacterium]
GELVENLWDSRGKKPDPLVAGVFFEALRILRRSEWMKDSLDGDASEKEGFDWQISRLAALEPSLREYLQRVPDSFRAQLRNAPLNKQREILAILLDLRADGGEAVMEMAKSRVSPLSELAIQLLRWSKDPQAGALLRDLVLQGVPMVKRAQHRPRSWRRPNRLPTPPLPYAPILRALRGHPCAQTEAILLLAARDWDPRYRQAAVSSLGWWEPIQQKDVLLTLQDSRRDPSGEVRLAARSALARLGERQSLTWFKQCLQSEDLGRVYDTMQEIVQEGLTLLWPEMDMLSEAESPEIAHQARECLECLSENLPSSPGFSE